MNEAMARVPDLRGWLAEFGQLADEFGDLAVDLRQHRLRVTTEPVVLEGVPLGSFAIALDWTRLGREPNSHCFAVEALDPYPASSDHHEGVTHPHVQKGVLCAGEASLPIRRALEEGRLADTFLLVRSVLTHYNPDSAYVKLADWDSDGDTCNDCGCRDDLSGCDRCGADHCSECLSSCAGCDNYVCSSCEDRCTQCEERRRLLEALRLGGKILPRLPSGLCWLWQRAPHRPACGAI